MYALDRLWLGVSTRHWIGAVLFTLSRLYDQLQSNSVETSCKRPSRTSASYHDDATPTRSDISHDVASGTGGGLSIQGEYAVRCEKMADPISCSRVVFRFPARCGSRRAGSSGSTVGTRDVGDVTDAVAGGREINGTISAGAYLGARGGAAL